MGAKERFKSDFMFRFLRGKIVREKVQNKLFETKSEFIPTKPLEFSDEARAIFKAGRELWAYYHSQNFNDFKKPYNANASLYDIKAHFQGFNENGKMNAPQKATDTHYKDLIAALNLTLKALATKITPKIYEYGFLKK